MRIRPISGKSTSQPPEPITADKLPACQFHIENSHEYVAASFFGITIFGTSVSMCGACFDLYGTGLEPSAGQTLRDLD